MRVALPFSAIVLFSMPIELLASSFQRLGGLPGADSQYSLPRDISADGAVVVGESHSANGTEAFRWTASEGMQGLGGLGGMEFASSATGVSANGLVVVGGSRSPLSGFEAEAFRWTATVGMVGLGDLPGGSYASGAGAVSGDGSTVTGSSASFVSPSNGEGFRWSADTGMLPIGGLAGVPVPFCVPRGISRDGSVIVGWSNSPQGIQAFRWTEVDGMVGLGDLPGGSFQSRANDLSDDGLVVVGTGLNPGQTAFLWTMAGGMVDLGRLPGGSLSGALGVSADGSVVVGDGGLGGDLVPIIWDATNGMRNLVDVFVEFGLGPEFEGWDLERATAVSADGLTIAGWGYNPNGDQEGWVAYIGQPSVLEVPTASNTALLVLGVALLIVALSALRMRWN